MQSSFDNHTNKIIEKRKSWKINEYCVAGESILAMCASEDGLFLVTGDTQGYIKVWDISEYCIEDAPSGKHARMLCLLFIHYL